MKPDYSESHILTEIEKIQYTYGLNRVIRFAKTRDEMHQTQSVAEHITNMMFCAYYFRDIEDPQHTVDFDQVIKLILMHDMGEIETGDILTVAKQASDTETERQAITQVVIKSPDFIAREVENNFERFENPTTPEERFARAIDKFEGLIFWFSDQGLDMIKSVHKNQMITLNYFDKLEQNLSKLGYKHILRYAQVAVVDMKRRGKFLEH